MYFYLLLHDFIDIQRLFYLLLKGTWVDVMEHVQSDIDPQKTESLFYKQGPQKALDWYNHEPQQR